MYNTQGVVSLDKSRTQKGLTCPSSSLGPDQEIYEGEDSCCTNQAFVCSPVFDENNVVNIYRSECWMSNILVSKSPTMP